MREGAEVGVIKAPPKASKGGRGRKQVWTCFSFRRGKNTNRQVTIGRQFQTRLCREHLPISVNELLALEQIIDPKSVEFYNLKLKFQQMKAMVLPLV